MKKILFVLVFFIFSCSQENKVDRQVDLDLKYPSFELSSVEQIKNKIEGSWVGKRSLLTKNSVEGQYRIEFIYDFEDSFTIYEFDLKGGEPNKKKVNRASLYQIDDYVFEVYDVGIFRLHCLSAKQLKLNSLLFERVEK